MGILIRMTKGNYINNDAVENVIHYITRTRANEPDGEALISVGGAGVAYYLGAEAIINQMKYVQNVFGIEQRGGRRMYHEVFQLSFEECQALGADGRVINEIALELLQCYFQKGHQAIFAIHNNREGVHIHLVVNTISYCTGLKWHDSMEELKERETCFNQTVYNYIGRIAARNNLLMANCNG